MSYTTKVVKTRSSVNIPWVANEVSGVLTSLPNEVIENSADQLMSTAYFVTETLPALANGWDESVVTSAEIVQNNYLKANGISRHITITNDETGEVVNSFFTW